MPSDALVPASPFDGIVSLVLNSVRSSQSQRAYRKALLDFLQWYRQEGHAGLNKAIVQQYRAELEKSGLAASSINLKLTAVRRLAAEAADNGLLSPDLAAGISRVKGTSAGGVRTGQWLSRIQTEELLNFPDQATNKGKRDRVVLALLVGCGLRRNELVNLQAGQVQQRDGRWVLADLLGKGNRVRTVPMPSWAKMVLDAWTAAAAVVSGPIVRAVNKSDRILCASISAQSVFNIVTGYGIDLKLKITPHDLRRTFAKLAHNGHAALEQIQLSLGHASIQTTERYLGIRQNLDDAPCDHLGVAIGA